MKKKQIMDDRKANGKGKISGTKLLESKALFSLFLAFLLFLFSGILYAQSNTTTSPYTYYGYGILADQSFTSQRGMGGVGYGLRSSQMINPLNPASFSAVDSMTFMMDFAVKGQAGWLKDQGNQATRYNAGLEYLALQFPLAKGLGMGAGFEPVSYVGYRFAQDTVIPSGQARTIYNGSGGLQKVYLALSYRLQDRLSAGVNLGYLFGDIIRSRVTSVSLASANTTFTSDTLRSSALAYEFGLQYRHPIGKNKEIVIGAVYTPKIKTGTTLMRGEVQYDSKNQLTGNPKYRTTRDSVFQLPESYSAGISYRVLNKWLAAADFQYQRWADAKFYDQTNTLTDRMKINAGTEFIPNVQGHNLFSKMRYRAGAYYTNSYFKVRGYGYQEYGASLGFGIPMVDKRSFINLAFEYAMIRPESSILVKEQYVKFTLGYTFNELWFFKRKLQ